MKRHKVIATLLASLLMAVSASAILAPGRANRSSAEVTAEPAADMAPKNTRLNVSTMLGSRS